MDEVIRKIAAAHGVTLAAAAELLKADPEIAEDYIDADAPPEIDSPSAFFATSSELDKHLKETIAGQKP